MMIEVRRAGCIAVLVIGSLVPLLPARAITIHFFNTNQVATLIATGTTSDTISSEGYRFTYTRDKFFTGGVGLTNPIGRSVRVPWPVGVEAQAVTTGPNTGKARITLARDDGAPFDLVSFTAKLLANTAGAGGSIEIMPVRADGEDAWNDPAYFSASGYYGSQFSYDTTPSYLGSTALLTNFAAYKIGLYVDFALAALTLEDPSIPSNHPPTGIELSVTALFENEPVGTYIGTLSAIDPDISDAFTYTLVAGPGGEDNARFMLLDADLYSAESFNFERGTNYAIRVETTDQGGLSAQASFTISVLDVDEPLPTMDPPEPPMSGAMIIRWTGQPNHTYALLCSTDLLHGFTTLYTNIASPDLMNVVTDAIPDGMHTFWMISTEP